MSPREVIILLSVIGFLLLAAETFVPGLVLGMLGAICLLAGVGIAYASFGILTGTFVLAGIGVLTLVGFTIWMFIFPNTPIGRRIMLQRRLVSGEGEKTRSLGLIGREGRALTPLRPAGTALIDDRRVDVVAEGELIELGDPVVVVFEEGMRVVVRKSVGPAAPAA